MAKKTSVVADKSKKAPTKKVKEILQTIENAKIEDNGLVDTITGTYVVTISVSDEFFTTQTDNIAEAVLSFVPSKLNSKTVVEIEKGDKRFVKIFNVFQARRLFCNKLVAELLERDAKLRLN